MARWFGNVGYAMSVEYEPGAWEHNVIEKPYYGDLITDRRRRQSQDSVNDSIALANVISILADPFAIQNCSYMAYAELMGTKWKITDVEVQYPRLLLTIGGVWNGDTA